MPLITGQSFPDYVFQEYPKWVTLPDGSKKIVEDANEEHQVLGTRPKEEDIEPPFVGFRGFDIDISQDTPKPLVISDVDPCVESEIVVSAAGNIIDDNIETLRTKADDLGLIYDKRWGAVKLRQAIDNARTK